MGKTLIWSVLITFYVLLITYIWSNKTRMQGTRNGVIAVLGIVGMLFLILGVFL